MANSKVVNAKVVIEALLKAIDMLGDDTAKVLSEDLKFYGVYLNDNESLDFKKLSRALDDLLGVAAAGLVFERFILELSRQVNVSRI